MYFKTWFIATYQIAHMQENNVYMLQNKSTKDLAQISVLGESVKLDPFWFLYCVICLTLEYIALTVGSHIVM